MLSVIYKQRADYRHCSFANQAVGEFKEHFRGVFADSRIIPPRKLVTINLAPADVSKTDSSFNLASAISILLASNQVKTRFITQEAFIGELGLGGARQHWHALGHPGARRTNPLHSCSQFTQAQLVRVQSLTELHG